MSAWGDGEHRRSGSTYQHLFSWFQPGFSQQHSFLRKCTMHPTPLPGLSGWRPLREMLIVLLGTALLILSGFLFQGRISVGNGLGWDGVAYANMAVNPHKSRMRLLLLPIGCACCFL